jgi:hypothetical protein
LKKYKSPGSDEILAELIQAGGEILLCVIPWHASATGSLQSLQCCLEGWTGVLTSAWWAAAMKPFTAKLSTASSDPSNWPATTVSHQAIGISLLPVVQRGECGRSPELQSDTFSMPNGLRDIQSRNKLMCDIDDKHLGC